MQARVTVVAGQVLTVEVGNVGVPGASAARVLGGYNGGGSGSNGVGSGGGATDLRQATTTGDYLTTRNALLVAAGGGGGNADQAGGGGGSPNGVAGNGSDGGGGATQTSAGSGKFFGQTGSNSSGGNGGTLSLSVGGGGGGGGYYGGGGGYNNLVNTSAGGGGSSWVEAGSTAVTYSAAPTASAGTMTITPVATPLPVTLSSFTAVEWGRDAVLLTWATASEYDNAGFVVERSTDGHTFAAVHTATGAGSSSQTHCYAWLDEQLPAGAARLFYRLQQLDSDGTANYSAVQVVAWTQVPGAALQLSPNPARTSPTLQGVTPGAWVRVFDVQGRQVYAVPASATGTAVLELPKNLPAGLYLVRTGAQTLRLQTE